MNLRLGVCLVLLGVFPGVLPAAAQTVQVTSGEHSGFSRIVLNFPTRVGWRLGRVPEGFEFRTGDGDEALRFALDRVYRRIGRARIAAIEDRGDGRLFLAVPCACHADAFDLRAGEVAIDIKDGPAPFENPFDAPLDAPVAEAKPAPGPPAPGIEESPAAEPEKAETTAIADLAAEADLRAARLGLPLIPSVPTSPTPTAPDRPAAEPPQPLQAGEEQPTPAPEGLDARISAMQNGLLGQMSRAASQGLIEADLGVVEDRIAAATGAHAPPDPPPPTPAPEPPVPERPGDSVHVNIETSIDRDLGSALQPHGSEVTGEGTECLADAIIDVGQWGPPIRDGADMSLFRDGMIGEFDRVNPGGLRDLVRYDIYLSFGIEAQMLLHRYPGVVEREGILHTLAEIVDNGHAARPEFLIPQMSCGGVAALWGTLAQPELNRGMAIDTDALLRSFSALPPHLRRHLGPSLAERFLAIGDRTTAVALRNAITRTDSAPDSRLQMLNARLDLGDGDIETATARMEDILTGDANASPEAVVALIETRIEQGEAVPLREVEIAAAHAFEQQGTETGQKLRRAEIRGRAHAGDIDAALRVLERASENQELSPAAARTLREEIIAELVRMAPDGQFLTYTIGQAPVLSDMPLDIRRAAAERLLGLGLGHPVPGLLAPGPDETPTNADRLLLARAALVERRGDRALVELAGLDGEEAALLRAAAHEIRDDFAGAAGIYAALGQDGAEARAGWRAGLWSVAAKTGPDYRMAAAGLMTGTLSDNSGGLPQEAPLAAAATLIDDSARTRRLLDNLLENEPQPEGQ